MGTLRRHTAHVPACICGHTCEVAFSSDLTIEKLTLFTSEAVSALTQWYVINKRKVRMNKFVSHLHIWCESCPPVFLSAAACCESAYAAFIIFSILFWQLWTLLFYILLLYVILPPTFSCLLLEASSGS